MVSSTCKQNGDLGAIAVLYANCIGKVDSIVEKAKMKAEAKNEIIKKVGVLLGIKDGSRLVGAICVTHYVFNTALSFIFSVASRDLV